MKKTVFQLVYLLVFLISASLLPSCGDTCKQTVRYQVMEPIYVSLADMQKSVASGPPQALQNPGKIWIYGHYLFINELYKGIHIVDNRNPAAPKPIGFVNIPANVDLAVRGQVLYADNHTNLLALDISDPQAVKLSSVLPDVFPARYYSEPNKGLIVDWKMVEKEEVVDCNGPMPGTVFDNRLFGGPSNSFALANAGNGGSTGQGGSMARFALVDDILYTVDNYSLKIFDVSTPTDPKSLERQNVGFGIETIFPYQDKLFLGSNTGMFIFSIAQPRKPARLGTYSHAFACDPVVVHGNLAYVTLRSGEQQCTRASNQLDVVDVSDPSKPRLVKTYPMQNPHGLGIDFPSLFVCEGKGGLKLFDAADPLAIDRHQLDHVKDIDAYDVIPFRNNLIMVGKDGIYQFDYTSRRALRQISVMPVRRQ